MRQILANIQFAKPWFFWLLIALPVLWVLLRRRRLIILFWRTIVLVLVVCALADPQLVTTHVKDASQERIFAFDLSQSIPPNMRQWMDSVTQSQLLPGPSDRTFVFGSETKETNSWRQWLKDSTQTSDIEPTKTNLQKLFETLLALPASPRTVFLFTDGWETQGDLERLLPSIAASGLKVFPIVPAARPALPNVTLAKLMTPTQGDSGEAINMRVVLENHNDRAVDGTLTLSRNGEPFKTDAVRLKPGSQIFSYQTTLSEGPLNSYRAVFTPRQALLDRYPSDDQALAWVSVRTKAKILLVNGRNAGRYLEEILKRQGFEVTARPPESAPAPAGFNVVIFNNVERERVPNNYLAALEKHVNAGNGFIMLGSEWSFGPGGYRRTPVETILPVDFKEPKQEEKNRAVVLVIDKSGSMREDNRILYAQEAAKAVARQLKDNDLLGVVGFDVSPFIVVPLAPVGSIRGTLNAQIERLKPGGRTFLLPAIVEAKRQIERQNAGRKHVIILSDGETGGSGGDYIDVVSVMRAEQKITVSSVAIGSEANVPLMKRISQYGGGFFHHTYDPSSLPQIVLQQMQEKPKEEPPPPEKDLIPSQERGSEILASWSGRVYPPVRGFIETELKRGAQMDLAISRDDHKAPLLASWHYGRGKTIALTTDLDGRWSRAWIPWNGLPGFWERILQWLLPKAESLVPLHEARVSQSGPQAVLDLYLYEDRGQDSQFRFSQSGKGSKSNGVLKKTAPGHYQASLPASGPGEYRVDIVEERKGQQIAYPPVGFTSTFDAASELPHPEFNLALLSKLAQISGGEINPQSLQTTDKQEVRVNQESVRGSIIAIIGILFFLEIALRMIVLREAS